MLVVPVAIDAVLEVAADNITLVSELMTLGLDMLELVARRLDPVGV